LVGLGEEMSESERSAVRRVALTGGIASGKSYVRARFEALGVPTIDADVLARQAVAPGTVGLAAVVTHFGQTVLRADGTLDRQHLAQIVFADAVARRALEAIVHPEVRRATDEWFAALDAGNVRYAMADIPLLYEVGRDRDFDAVVVVACEPDTQRRRLKERDGMSDAEARQRISAQWPIDQKVSRADYVIRTDGTYEETDRQVTKVFDGLSS
jgi:dephospho-CoA kinase